MDHSHHHGIFISLTLDSRSIPSNEEIQYIRRIKSVLSFLREKGLEVMYIYYYKKNEFRPELDLEDLWKIYDWDLEWEQFYKLKLQLQD